MHHHSYVCSSTDVCVCKIPHVRVVNAFSQMLRGTIFSTFPVGKSTYFEECIPNLRNAVQFASDMRVWDESPPVRDVRVCECGFSDASWEFVFRVCCR